MIIYVHADGRNKSIYESTEFDIMSNICHIKLLKILFWNSKNWILNLAVNIIDWIHSESLTAYWNQCECNYCSLWQQLSAMQLDCKNLAWSCSRPQWTVLDVGRCAVAQARIPASCLCRVGGGSIMRTVWRKVTCALSMLSKPHSGMLLSHAVKKR